MLRRSRRSDQDVSPSDPKNTARWLLSIPITEYPASQKCRQTSEPINPHDPVTKTHALLISLQKQSYCKRTPADSSLGTETALFLRSCGLQKEPQSGATSCNRSCGTLRAVIIRPWNELPYRHFTETLNISILVVYEVVEQGYPRAY